MIHHRQPVRKSQSPWTRAVNLQLVDNIIASCVDVFQATISQHPEARKTASFGVQTTPHRVLFGWVAGLVCQHSLGICEAGGLPSWSRFLRLLLLQVSRVRRFGASSCWGWIVALVSRAGASKLCVRAAIPVLCSCLTVSWRSRDLLLVAWLITRAEKAREREREGETKRGGVLPGKPCARALKLPGAIDSDVVKSANSECLKRDL